MGWPAEQLALPQPLRDSINEGRCVVFVGSGASAGCYDPWHTLINSLCERCGSKLRVASDSLPDEFLAAAEDAKLCGDRAYYEYLGNYFGKPPTRTTLLYRALLALNFKSYLTTNLDRLLAIEAKSSSIACHPHIKAYPSLDRQFIGARCVYYLHGFIEQNQLPQPDSVVLARSDFDVAYADNSELMNFLIQALEHDPLCFVGCRLREPPMKQVFGLRAQHQQRRLEQHNGPPPPPQYILLSRPEVHVDNQFNLEASQRDLDEQEQYYRSIGVTTVWYSALDGDHYALQQAFEQLAELQSPTIDWGK